MKNKKTMLDIVGAVEYVPLVFAHTPIHLTTEQHWRCVLRHVTRYASLYSSSYVFLSHSDCTISYQQTVLSTQTLGV